MARFLAALFLLLTVGLAQAVPVYDVRTFGAKCDGITDDTAAINATVVAAGTVAGGPATVLLPPGTCMVSAGQSDAITIKYDNIDFAGAGTFATILKNKSTSRATIIHAYKGTYPGGTTIIKNVTIRDLTVDGNQANITHNANDTYQNGVNLDFAQNSRVTGVFCQNVVFQCIVFQGSGDGTSKNNRADHNIVTAFGEYGIGLEGGTYDSSIENNLAYGGITVPEVAGGSVALLVSQIGQTGTGNQVISNVADGMPSDCVRVQDGSAYSSVIGNTLKNCGTTAGAGIRVSGQTTSPNHISIIGNTLTAASSSSLAAITISSTSTAVGFAHVSGNKIADTAGGGVLFSSGKNNSAVGNHITNCGTGAGTVTSGVRAAGSTVAPLISSNYINTCAGAGVEIVAGTTSALVKGNTSISNGTQYSDAGTSTVLDGIAVAYTPTWTAVSVNPALGNGTITGRYVRIGNTVHVNIRLVIGTTTTLGTGAWFFSLPFTGDVAIQNYTGTAYLLHTGISEYAGVVKWDSSNGARIFTGAQPATTVAAAVPFAWAATDELDIQITYPVAGGV